MKTAFYCLCLAMIASEAPAGTDVKVAFTLNTTNANGAPITQSRSYWLYRPDNRSRTQSVPLILCMESGGNAPMTFFHRLADQAGFILVSSTFQGNSLGTVWNNDNPRISGFEDMDCTTAVIDRVTLSDNCNDGFICGLSKGGHMASKTPPTSSSPMTISPPPRTAPFPAGEHFESVKDAPKLEGNSIWRPPCSPVGRP